MELSFVKQKIAKNHSIWERMVQRALLESGAEKKILLCAQAALFAVNNPCGVMASPEIEKELCKIAQDHSVPLSEEFEPDHVLHILTRAYETGGHTRVCERWIEAEGQMRHSVVILNQATFPLPGGLQKAVTGKDAGKNGNIEISGPETPLEKAIWLRQLASRYGRIILYTHMHDVVPLLAFGTEEFKRPVLYYNHADHLFWLGGSIADMVVNFRTVAVEHNRSWRGVSRNYVLPLPAGDLSGHKKDKARMASTREKLRIPPGAKALITIAAAYKYRPFAGLDFTRAMSEIMGQNKDCYLLVIGPQANDPVWEPLLSKFGQRIRMLGTIPHHQLDSYLEIADVALESFPLGSPTALIDALRFGIPCLSLRTPPNTYDAFEEAGIICDTTDEYIAKTLMYLSSGSTENRLKDILERESSPLGFSEKIGAALEKAPSCHRVYAMTPDRERNLSDFELFIAHQSLIKESKSRLITKSIIRRLAYWFVRCLPAGVFNKTLYPALARLWLA